MLRGSLRPREQLIERGSVEVTSRGDHGADAAHFADVVERVGIQYEVGLSARCHGSKCRLATKITRRSKQVVALRSTMRLLHARLSPTENLPNSPVARIGDVKGTVARGRECRG